MKPSYTDARWFIILREQNRTDEAKEVLHKALAESDEKWLQKVLKCLDGQIDPDELLEAADTAQRRCEAYYYAGEACNLLGRGRRRAEASSHPG